MLPSLTCVLTTINRPTLKRTLTSLQRQHFTPYDRILLVSDGEHGISPSLLDDYGLPGRIITMPGGPHYDWGHTPRNRTAHLIETSHVLHFDDDDIYLDGAWVFIRQEIIKTPVLPLHFQLEFGNGAGIIHQEPLVRLGNVATIGFVHPNNLSRQGIWQSRHGGDYDFINQTAKLYQGLSDDYTAGIKFINQIIAVASPI